MLKAEKRKGGAGLLFFAYGASERRRHRLLHQAEQSARSFRGHNAGISISVVANNASVNRDVFDAHIVPRPDLLFAGEAEGGDKEPRLSQHLTRIYYIAHSPYELTWVLSSSARSCSPDFANRFLQDALDYRLWGFHVAHHSSSPPSASMEPLTSDLLFLWREETSSLLRDWFMLQLRHGVAAEDVSTLRLAERRLMTRMRNKLMVGMVAPELGARFYEKPPLCRPGLYCTKAKANVRTTPALSGPVHVLHDADQISCAVANSQSESARQILFVGASKFLTVVTSYEDCMQTLGASVGSIYCMLARKPYSSPTSGEGTNGTHLSANRSMGSHVLASLAPASTPVSTSYLKRASFDNYEAFIHSDQCGTLCTKSSHSNPSERAAKLHPMDLHRTSFCRAFKGARLGEVTRDAIKCPSGTLMRSLQLAAFGCTTAGKMRFEYICARYSTTPRGEHWQSTRKVARCNDGNGRLPTIDKFSEFGSFECPPGYALTSLDWAPPLCNAEHGLHYNYQCASISGYSSTPPSAVVSHSVTNHSLQHKPLFKLNLPPREPYDSETLCTPLVGKMYDALEAHPVICGPHHVLLSFRLTNEGCAEASEMHFVFRCMPLRSREAFDYSGRAILRESH